MLIGLRVLRTRDTANAVWIAAAPLKDGGGGGIGLGAGGWRRGAPGALGLTACRRRAVNLSAPSARGGWRRAGGTPSTLRYAPARVATPRHSHPHQSDSGAAAIRIFRFLRNRWKNHVLTWFCKTSLCFVYETKKRYKKRPKWRCFSLFYSEK